MLKETLGVTFLNLSNLPSRIGASIIIVVGIGGVVAVLLGLLAMSTGFRASLTEIARPDRVLIVRGDSNNELSGWITSEQLGLLETSADIEVASGEIYVTIAMLERGTGMAVDVAGRGVSTAAFALRDEVGIVRGRVFEFGTSEIIVGVKAAARYEGLEIGDQVEARTVAWTVVGHFAAADTAVESEIWFDLAVGQDVFRRPGGVSVVRARLAADATVDAVAQRLASDLRLNLVVIPETEFFARQMADRSALISTFAYFIAGIMAIGSVLAALNTMYVAVSRRTSEIAVLRTIGFSRGSVVTSVMVEAMLLAVVGGTAGVVLVFLALDGYATSVFNNATSTQVAFAFRVTPDLAVTGFVWALVLGFIGGLLPAIRAARMPITQALRGE